MSKHASAHVPLNFNLVAKIGIAVAMFSCLALGLLLLAVVDDKGNHYWQVISTFDVARQTLDPAMLVFGLTMICFAGVTTWLLALYASFRVAGPVYRIARDLEQQIAHGTVEPVPIRKTDVLQRQWREFEAGVAALRLQHEKLRLGLADVEKSLAAGPAQAAAAIERMKEAEQHVRL